jgi:hypothetical protein
MSPRQHRESRERYANTFDDLGDRVHEADRMRAVEDGALARNTRRRALWLQKNDPTLNLRRQAVVRT